MPKRPRRGTGPRRKKRGVRPRAAARREAETAAMLERQFATIEGRIEACRRGLDENQVEPVREELLELVQQMSEYEPRRPRHDRRARSRSALASTRWR